MTISKRERVVAALLTSGSRREAAQKAGVSERTVYNYLQNADVRQEYAQARQDLIRDASDQIQQALEPAVRMLARTVQNPRANIRIRITAARALLDYGIKYGEITDVAARLDALEQAEK